MLQPLWRNCTELFLSCIGKTGRARIVHKRENDSSAVFTGEECREEQHITQKTYSSLTEFWLLLRGEKKKRESVTQVVWKEHTEIWPKEEIKVIIS